MPNAPQISFDGKDRYGIDGIFRWINTNKYEVLKAKALFTKKIKLIGNNGMRLVARNGRVCLSSGVAPSDELVFTVIDADASVQKNPLPLMGQVCLF